MELLILAGVAMVLAATVLLAIVKLLVVFLVTPAKLLGAAAAGLVHLFWIPFKLAAVFAIVVGVFVGLLALPVAVPLVVVGGLLLALAC